MAEPGWYPDPGGRAGHYRFWDGQAWGLGTTTELPGGASPEPGPGAPRRRHGRRWLLVGTALAVVLVLVVVGALVVRERTRDTAGPGTSTSAPGGNDGPSSAVPSPPSVTPSPTPTPTPTPAPTSAPVDCPIGDPLTRQPHPQDGRVHGGGLSFVPPSGWVEDRRAAALSWTYDVGEADQQVRGTWYTGAAVGAVSVIDAGDVRSAAELMMACTASSFFYPNLSGRTDLVDQGGDFQGMPSWTIRSEIRMDDPYVDVPGDVAEVVAVDLGSGESFAFFWGTAPLDDPALVAQLDAVAESVQPD